MESFNLPPATHPSHSHYLPNSHKSNSFSDNLYKISKSPMEQIICKQPNINNIHSTNTMTGNRPKHCRNPHRPWDCDNCLATFIDKEELAIHIKLYHPQTPTDECYECERCDIAFNTFQSLMDHNVSTHKRGPKTKGSKHKSLGLLSDDYSFRNSLDKKRKFIKSEYPLKDIKEYSNWNSTTRIGSKSELRSDFNFKTRSGARSSISSSASNSNSDSIEEEEEDEGVDDHDSDSSGSGSNASGQERDVGDEGDEDINQILRNLNRRKSIKPLPKGVRRPNSLGSVQRKKCLLVREEGERKLLESQGFRPSRWRRKKGEDLQHKCTFCPYASNSASHLKYHIMIHTGEKPFHCHLCERKFRQKAHLNVHLASHH